ncbi:MAG TPA: heme-binding protein [Chthoniobacterales bacterium]
MDLLKTSKRFAELAEEEALRFNVPITVSVVDHHGNIVLKQRMTGAPLISLEMSERKAYTSALLSMRTEEITPLVQPGQPFYTLTSAAGGRFVALGGGIPLWAGEECVAGVGVSGGTTEQDVMIAEAAFRRLNVNS